MSLQIKKNLRVTWIGSLHREQEVVEIVLPADLGELHCRLHHAARRIAPERHDSGGERTVICADSEGSVLLFAFQHQWGEQLFDFLNINIVLLLKKIVRTRLYRTFTD